MRKKVIILFISFIFFLSKSGNAQDYERIVKNSKEIFNLNLKNFLNWSYDDKEEIIGWIGASPDTDLADIPKGNVNLCGVPFYIYPEINGKSIISVGYAYEIPLLNLPLKVGPIPVNKKADYLFFLHSSAWVRIDKGGVVGIYKIIYEDGREINVEVRRGYEIEDWWFGSKDLKLENGKVAWTKKLEKGKREVGIFISLWKNPYPETEIKEIVIEGNKKAQFFVFAITGIKN